MNTLVFYNTDGTETLYLHGYPVKYIDASGAVRDKTDKIRAVSGQRDLSFQTDSSDIITGFGKTIADGIRLAYDDIEIKLTPALPLSSPRVGQAALSEDEKTVAYPIDEHTRLDYSLTAMGFKEDIVLEQYTGQNEFFFTLETNGLELWENDGSFYLRDETGEIRACIGDVIAFTADDRNNTLGKMTVEELEKNHSYALALSVEKSWLTDEKTAYPVRIDPTIEISYANNGAGAIQDVTLNSLTGSDGSSSSVYVGKRGTYGISRLLMRFPGLNLSSLSVPEITSANVQIRDMMCEAEHMTVDCYVFDGNTWNESTANWNNVNADAVLAYLDSKEVFYGNGMPSSVHRYAFDITDAVRGWRAGTYSQSKGIMFKSTYYMEQYGNPIYKTFASYNRSTSQPSLVVNYASRNTTAWGSIPTDEGGLGARGEEVKGNNVHVTFSVGSSGIYYIETGRPGEETSVRDTVLYLYNNSTGSLIASNDDGQGLEAEGIHRLYSRIEVSLQAGVTYRAHITEYQYNVNNMHCYLMVYSLGSLGKPQVGISKKYYSDRARDFIRKAGTDSTYTCLGYALYSFEPHVLERKYTTYLSESLSYYDSFLAGYGYSRVPSYTSNCIIAYGSTNLITHFAVSKVVNGITVISAKLQEREEVYHKTYNTSYFATGVNAYGPPVAYYIKTSPMSIGTGTSVNMAAQELYNEYFAKHFDPELRDFVYDLIDNTQWPESQGNMPKLEEFYDEYLVFESHGKKILPYILSYIEERQTQDRFITARLLIIANKMLGHDSIRTSYDGSPLSSAPDWHSFNGWARLLWEEVFTP